MTEPRRAGRLDQPREPGRIILPRLDKEAFGRFAETFARFMGTARFIVYMTIFVIVWVALNLIGLFGLRWDPYPFILLNLFFSTQASYAAPLILLAQNRQADRDRVSLDEDRRRAQMQKADTEYLSREIASLRIALGEVATRDFIRSELTRLVEEVDEATHRRLKAERADRAERKDERKEQRKDAKRAARRAEEAGYEYELEPDDQPEAIGPGPEMQAPRASRG
ncbi:DUF1003 domain-containing protein [Planosporangium thailandense]|uniref:DUF1003 domain-containing protein n=1 Tax=Planosporangium thailandense TaxID=765197 RepID=A0ABX0XVS3_9ACTN|nr:DUF1003 domain-containing protein [Planosporangium thailandense]NJC69354.1 DUF1003 domain-containing protein [Planosporangium thailandense]